MKATATIYGTAEQQQEVSIVFEYYKISKWFNGDTYFVNYCNIVDRLNFRPSCIDQDVACGIAQALGLYDERDIRIECNPTYSFKPVKQDIDFSKILFI